MLPAEDYASASTTRSVSAAVIDRQQCDVNNDRGVVGNMVQLPEDQLKSDSSRCGGSVIGPAEANVQDRSVVRDDPSAGNIDGDLGQGPCVIDEARISRGIRSGSEVITVDTMKQQPQVNKDINHSMDIDRSFAVVDGQQEEDEDDPYAELDMYLEKVKVCSMCFYSSSVVLWFSIEHSLSRIDKERERNGRITKNRAAVCYLNVRVLHEHPSPYAMKL